MAVLAVTSGTTLIYFVLGYADGPIWLVPLIAYYTATTQGHRLAAAIAAVVAFVIGSVWAVMSGTTWSGKPAAARAADLAALAAWLLAGRRRGGHARSDESGRLQPPGSRQRRHAVGPARNGCAWPANSTILSATTCP